MGKEREDTRQILEGRRAANEKFMLQKDARGKGLCRVDVCPWPLFASFASFCSCGATGPYVFRCPIPLTSATSKQPRRPKPPTAYPPPIRRPTDRPTHTFTPPSHHHRHPRPLPLPPPPPAPGTATKTPSDPPSPRPGSGCWCGCCGRGRGTGCRRARRGSVTDWGSGGAAAGSGSGSGSVRRRCLWWITNGD